MRRLNLIGIGAGDPEDLTVKAVKELNRSDVLFFSAKERDRGDLLRYRQELCRRYIEHTNYRIVEITDPPRDTPPPADTPPPTDTPHTSYATSMQRWYDQRVAAWEEALLENLGSDQTGAFLVWGDPGLYDGTLRILEAVRARREIDFELTVVPGISAVQSLTARHRTTLNQVGGSVLITTGRELLDTWTDRIDDAVVMLDPHCRFADIEDRQTRIYWGAYLGTPDEILISGTIDECGDEIERARAEAKERHGWVFDTYLLRRDRTR